MGTIEDKILFIYKSAFRDVYITLAYEIIVLVARDISFNGKLRLEKWNNLIENPKVSLKVCIMFKFWI